MFFVSVATHVVLHRVSIRTFYEPLALCLLRSSWRSDAASYRSVSLRPNPVRSHQNAGSSQHFPPCTCSSWDCVERHVSLLCDPECLSFPRDLLVSLIGKFIRDRSGHPSSEKAPEVRACFQLGCSAGRQPRSDAGWPHKCAEIIRFWHAGLASKPMRKISGLGDRLGGAFWDKLTSLACH